MIDLCQWRARIGSWNCCQWSQSRDCTTSNNYCKGTSGTGRGTTTTTQLKTPRLVFSIFCLVILLFISGDVELNPGPTLTDKPTRDELIELLSSSKFTAGTWEQFVCCLPNMTQEIVIDIKQREKGEHNNPICYMNAVAQHFIDSNPDITWRSIIDALLDANEVTAAHYILDMHSSTSACGNICRTVKQVLQSHYAKLAASTETCLQGIANEMYSKNLINREVRNLPTFAKIEVDFSALLSLHTEDMKKTEELCWLFLDCLATVEGPAKEEAIALAKDWECEVFNGHQILFSLKRTPFFNVPKEIQLNSKDQITMEVQSLRKRYAVLMTKITAYYDTSRRHDTLCIARWVQNTFDETGLACAGVTIDDIFEKMKPHYSFLDVELINDLIEVYPIDDTALKSRFEQYAKDLDSFIESAKLNNVMTAVKAAIIGETTKADPKVILKLSGKWNERTIRDLKELTKHLFGNKSKHLTIERLSPGSIQIQLLVSSYKIVPCLIERAKACVQFMHHFGIFQMTINDQTIIDADEDANFSFEESLLHTIRHIESHSEYERIALLLIEFEVQLNYQNNEGETALTLASEGGYIDIFKSLLLHGANPFVQLPENKGFIGLNSLACTVLSHHIHSSISGEKIIPQPGTCVGDMLEWAVRERGASDSVYNPFVSIIENKLIERFQSLHCCFQALENKFHDSSNRALVNKTLVTEARHIFYSYIEEEVKCDNVYELLQVLKPHYSCLNINLLNIACTIMKPIKEMVDSYNTKLKAFKDTTTLSELVMMTSTKETEANVGDKCSKLVLELNRSWGSRTITELNKMEAYFLLPISSFLNLIVLHQDGSSFTCTYLIPASQFQPVLDIVKEKCSLLHKIGVYEIFVDSTPVLVEDEDESFNFEDALQKAYQDNDEEVLFFLIELNISLPSASDIVPSVIRLKKQLPQHINALKNIVESIEQQVAAFAELRDINCRNNHQGTTFLMEAVLLESYEMVQMLLNEHINVDVQDSDGNTALMIACENKQLQIVDLLLSKDPKINIQNNDGWTALMVASRYGHHQVVELLLSKDPNIDIQNNNGGTALMYASCSGHHQVVELLLSKDPDINIQDKDGVTALMLSSHCGHQQVVELLLSKDLDINIQSRNCAFSMEDIIIAFTIACYKGHSSIMILLSKKLPTLSNDERKLLVAAAEGDIGTLVSMLFEVGMSPDTPLVGDITPLMIAASCGHIDIVDTLIQAGADVNKTNDGGKTALNILLGMKEEGTSSAHIIDLLITNGASAAAQANPTQLSFKEIFSPSSNISMIRSMSKTSTETVERPAQVNESAQKVQELSENELTQYSQQH